MIEVNKTSLLQDSRVVEEINKYKWIESERVGYDIGLDQAIEEWIHKYGSTWQKEYISNRNSFTSVRIKKNGVAPIRSSVQRKIIRKRI